MEPELTERVDAVQELADGSFKRRFFVDDELELLPERLEDGERPLAFLSTTRGFRAGLLVATNRRLIFFALVFREDWLEWPYDAIQDVRIERARLGSRLLVAAGGHVVFFREHKKRDGEAFVETVLPLLRSGT